MESNPFALLGDLDARGVDTDIPVWMINWTVRYFRCITWVLKAPVWIENIHFWGQSETVKAAIGLMSDIANMLESWIPICDSQTLLV